MNRTVPTVLEEVIMMAEAEPTVAWALKGKHVANPIDVQNCIANPVVSG
jgi:hypothetical protein